MMQWPELLSCLRHGQKSTHSDENRTAFQRDYDRLIFSAPFRRLQNKTQVFPLPGSIFVHNRLTHSLEVASIGRSLAYSVATQLYKESKLGDDARRIDDIASLVSASCLAHDLGNPPFGHSGEKAIGRYFLEFTPAQVKEKLTPVQWADLTRFEGNANAFRALTHRFEGRRSGGFCLTYATLSVLVKYPYGSDVGKKKFGFFNSEKETYRQIAETLGIPEIEPGVFARHPLVYLLEAADDMAYLLMDIEDAHRLHIFSSQEAEKTFLSFYEKTDKEKIKTRLGEIKHEVTDTNEQLSYLRAGLIGHFVEKYTEAFAAHYNEIMNGTLDGTLGGYLPQHTQQAMGACRKLSTKEIYNHRSVVEVEITGYNVLQNLLGEFVPAVLNPDTEYSRKVLAIIPEQFKCNTGNTYIDIQSVVDFISGMTDLYAMDLYRILKGIRN
jgi:dGTPase